VQPGYLRDVLHAGKQRRKEEKMKKRSFLLVVGLAVAVVFSAAGIYAAATVPDDVEMKADYKHTKSTVIFTHKKHVEDYKIGCGECHHNDKGEPLNDLKAGDDVQSCFACHNKPGELKGKKAKGKSKQEKLEYHANAMHGNCVGCHKVYNKENKTKAAPQKCTGCHPKKKK
jgi:hypothetical protein